MKHNNKVKRGKFLTFHNLFSSVFGIGWSNYAPGTLGSLSAFFFWFLLLNISQYLDFSVAGLTYFITFLLILLTVTGTYTTNKYIKEVGKKRSDPKEVVIDEVVGQLMVISYTYIFIDKYTNFTNASLNNLIIYGHLLSCFVLFRFFDILKPSLVGYVDRNIKGGLGVMLDDIMAAVYSIILINLMIFITELYFSSGFRFIDFFN